MDHLQEKIEEIGLKSQRIKMINLSAAMAGQFAQSAAELTEEIRKIGPSPLTQNGKPMPADDD